MAINAIKNRGFALLIAVIFMSAMLSVGLALSSLAYKQQILSSTAVDSQYAFYSADSALECALHEDQQNNLFEWPSSDPSSAPVMACENLSPYTTPTKVWDSTHWVVKSRFAIESGKYCADVTVSKPRDVGTTYIFSEGYNVPCATVASPDGKRFLSRGLKSTYSTAAAIQDPGIEWVNRASAADNSWNSVTYGNDIFVAVASSGTGNRVMTSANGVDWLPVSSIVNNAWKSVTFGNGIFVAVACSVGATGCNFTSGNRAMFSSDGIIWNTRAPSTNQWTSVTFGNDKFVALASGTGSGNRVMTSSDGSSWNPGSIVNNAWSSVAFGNGVFVAVACGISATSCNSISGRRMITSVDGVSWIESATTTTSYWVSVAYGNGTFVAVAANGPANKAVYSTDNGVTWNSSTGTPNQLFRSVTYGLGLFVAVASTGSGVQVMTSPDGITWTQRSNPTPSRIWNGVTAGPDGFVAVSSSGTGNRVMTSGL